MNKRNLPFWLFVISFFIIIIVRDLFQDGMFMDGVIYATVAKNLAGGLGTFWHPHFSQTAMRLYHEQPPLLFGIEAIFFKILGNGMYVERIYGLLVALITIFLIYKSWKNIFYDKQEKNISWLPVLFWLSIPVCFWSYSNNMEEPTMGMFDLAALFFISRAIIHNKKPFFNLGIAALMLIAASMCKGVQGLFPLAAIFFYWILFRSFSFGKMFLFSAFLFICIAAFYGLILLNHTVFTSYEMYFHDRIVAAFAHPAATHADRFYIIKQLFSELAGVFILMLFFWIFSRIKHRHFSADNNVVRISIWFLLIGLSGTLPLLLTIEQSGYYLVTAMPYYAIGFAVFFTPAVSALIEQINLISKQFKIWTVITWVILASSIVFSAVSISSGPKRDQELLHDVYLTGSIIKSGSIIGISNEMSGDWSLQAYYNRYYYISLDASAQPHEYFLLDKTLDQKLVPVDYKILPLPTQKYNLYVRNLK